MHLRNVPTRLAAGGYILHTGLEKWNGSEEQAKGLHALASAAYPVLDKVPPATLLKALSIAEMSIGTALLLPVVGNKIAGTLLAGFGGGLVALYLRTPALRQPGSVWPNQSGIAVSKDVWVLGIGLGLLADDATNGTGKRRSATAAA
jgi:hypothetical protein